MDRYAHRWLRKPWFTALLLTVLVFRAVLPPGFMLGATDAGGFGLHLCSLAAAAARLPGGPAPSPASQDGDARHDSGVCPFAAALGGTAPPADAWQLPLPAPSGTGFADASTPPTAGSRSAAHLPRGPPPIA